jgi:hypothetical protein
MMKTTTIPEDDEDIDDDDARILVELHGDSLRAIERHLNVLARMDAMRCDGLSLLRLYSGSTQALLRLYSGSTQALLRLYSGSTQALLRLYSGSFLPLHRQMQSLGQRGCEVGWWRTNCFALVRTGGLFIVKIF